MSAFRGRKYTILLVIFLESLKISNVEASKGKNKNVAEGVALYSFILKVCPKFCYHAIIVKSSGCIDTFLKAEISII